MAVEADDFLPFPLLASGDLQSLLGTLLLTREPRSERQLVELPDGDQLALEITTPRQWRPQDRTVVMIHGLCGCHRSPYLVRMAARLERLGVRAVRLNLRGCGSGEGLARGIYHSGSSGDVRAVLESLQRNWPGSPFSLVGFSLGGNIALKLAGELGDGAGSLIDRVVGICPPIDLDACSRMLSLRRNRLYDRYFLRLLRRMVQERHERFEDLGPCELPDCRTLREFDDVYTAPHGGFESAEDYYARASAAPLVPSTRVPCRILFARDDPFVAADTLDGVDLPPNVEVLSTSRGGHIGFLGRPWAPGGVRWMDSLLERWLGLVENE